MIVKLNGCTFWYFEELSKEYGCIWNKVSNSMETEFVCEPWYNKKNLRSKIKYSDFHDKEIPSVGSNYTCLTTILINFIFKRDGKCYLQVLFQIM